MTLIEFEIQFRTLYLPLGMYALRFVGDVDESEDIVQEAFSRAWEKLAEGTQIDSFKSWMYRCVRNICIDRLRTRHERLDVSVLENEPIEEIIDTSERDAAIWKAIDRLPEKCRVIFLMSKRDGLTNEEIAQELQLSVKTVKNQLSKAFARLRESLKGERKPFFLPFL